MYLLKLKHWQVFVLIFILPFILQYIATQLFAALEILTPILSIVVAALPPIVPVAWLWWVGFHFYKGLPGRIKVSAVYFHLGALYFILYLLLLTYTLGVARDNIADGTLPIGMLILLMPMHLFATFCYLYLTYFAARSIVSVQKQRVVTIAEYIIVAIQVLFLPIGIWFIQPRLNKLALE
jgi:hypothetical protein